MPLYRYKCTVCGDVKSSFREDGVSIKCLVQGCEGEFKRDANPPTTTLYERIDNGLMPKAVERLDDIERMSRERSKARK